MNAEFNNLLNALALVNTDVSASAAIVESKLLFSTSGHGHSGGTDGKLITVSRGYGFFIAGTPSVANDLSWDPAAPAAQTATRLTIHVQTAPTGASLIARVYNITQAVAVASVTLTAGSTDANTTTMTTAAIAQNDVLRADITQIGSTVAGANISLVLNVTQP